ncbi:hypothetical protein [Streptomyces europaeiscabiei]|uniref:hypothetical protein n=1 Tax=Streptomyces europaeiscabiei TaxID=146819 RepID=UPI002E176D5C
MPINIVPAPVGQFVALYLKTTIPELHREYRIHLADADGMHGNNRVIYIVRPVVAWGFYRDQDELWLTNHAMVICSEGSLVFAGLKGSHLSQELRSFSDAEAEMGFPLDSICTPAEMEARLAWVTEAAPRAVLIRQTAAQFGDEYRLTLPHSGK